MSLTVKIDLLPFEEISRLISSGQIVKTVFEPSLQRLETPVMTLIKGDGTLLYGKVKYDQATNQIFPPQESVPTDPLGKYLGKLFASVHSYRQPDIYQVVGQTKTMLIARTVPFLPTFDITGGSGHVDKLWIQNNPITTPLTKSTKETQLFYPKEYNGRLYIKRGDTSASEVPNLDHTYNWVNY